MRGKYRLVVDEMDAQTIRDTDRQVDDHVLRACMGEMKVMVDGWSSERVKMV